MNADQAQRMMVAMVDETQSDQPGPEQSKPDETGTLSRPTPCRRPDEGLVGRRRVRRDRRCAGRSGLTIRAATILLSFTGFGIVAYIVAALIMRDTNGARIIDRRGTKELLLYAAVAIVGWITLPEMIFGSELKGRVNVLSSMFPWLLLLGGLALVLRTGPGDRATTPMPMDAPPQPASSASDHVNCVGFPNGSGSEGIFGTANWVGIAMGRTALSGAGAGRVSRNAGACSAHGRPRRSGRCRGRSRHRCARCSDARRRKTGSGPRSGDSRSGPDLDRNASSCRGCSAGDRWRT